MPTSATSPGGVFTWTWVEDVPVHFSITGDPCVVAPDGITITSISPASTQDPISGRVINGGMVNRNASTSDQQGYDSAARDNKYVPALNAARPGGGDLGVGNPLFLPANSSLISAKSIISPLQLRPQISDAAVLTVLATTPPADFFRPSPYGAGTKVVPAVLSDLDWDKVPSLTKPAGATWPTDLSALSPSARMARLWVETGTQFSGRVVHPANNMPAYGQAMARVTEAALLYLCLDYSQSQKAHVLHGLLQYGCDLYGARVSGAVWPANGGHNMGRLVPLVLAGHLLGKPAFIAIAQPGTRPFQEHQSLFYVSSAEVSRTQNNEPGSGGWSPDGRDPARPIRYTTSMIDTPEWGINHTAGPADDNAHWGATYRNIAMNHMVGHVLAAHIFGVSEALNFPVFVEFIDRYWLVDSQRNAWNGTNDISNIARAMWLAYRERPEHPPVWGKDGRIPTVFQSPATALSVIAGGSQTLSVTAWGLPDPAFQWRKGGVNISGATSRTLAIVSAISAAAGVYDCVVSNSFGSVITNTTTLTVTGTDPVDTDPPSWLGNPAVTSLTHHSAALSATSSESGTIYWLLKLAASPSPTAQEVAAGFGGIQHGSVAGIAGLSATWLVEFLSAATSYKVYVAAADGVPNLQPAPYSVEFTTEVEPTPPPDDGPVLRPKRRRNTPTALLVREGS